MFTRDSLHDISANAINASQDAQLAHHKKHIQVLWNHIERLEQFITTQGDGSVRIAVGNSSITLKKNGEITLKGNDITIDGQGKITIKGSSDVIIKGSRILQN